MHTHTHTHTHTYTHMHAHIYTNTHTVSSTHVKCQARAQQHMPGFWPQTTYPFICFPGVPVYPDLSSIILVYPEEVHAHTHTHTCMHAHTHTRTHTHTHTHNSYAYLCAHTIIYTHLHDVENDCDFIKSRSRAFLDFLLGTEHVFPEGTCVGHK